MSATEPSEPCDLAEDDTATTEGRASRRRLVVEEFDDGSVVVIVNPTGTSKAEAAAGYASASDVDEEASSWVDRAGFVRSLLEAAWSEDLALNIAPHLTWSKHLPDGERHHLVDEARHELQKSMASGDLEPYFQLLDAWQSTAEVWADPETLAALTTDPDPDGDTLDPE